MSTEVGIPLSTLVKVEADKLSLTYDKLQHLARPVHGLAKKRRR
jgi:hypothetical protein